MRAEPFYLDVENWRLSYTFRDDKDAAVPAVISEEKGKIRIDIDGSGTNIEQIINDARHLLRLDDDLDGFYDAIVGHDRLNWVGERQAGRLLRSSTVFEDLVKTICTTNCSWALTRMSSAIWSRIGQPPTGSEPGAVATGLRDAGGSTAIEYALPANIKNPVAIAPGSDKAFPTAEAMASMDEDFYRNEIRAGYRSPYFVELAEAVASGRLDPEKWLISDLPTPELKKEMKKVKGVGD